MAEDNSLKLFGFEIKRQGAKKAEPELKSIVPPTDDDGATYVSSIGSGAAYGQYVDLSGMQNLKDNVQLIKRYRNMATQPEVDQAIDEIVNEAISTNEDNTAVELNTEKADLPASIKTKMKKEFEGIHAMLNFTELAHDIFRSWYVDGRLYHHLILDPNNPKGGIKEIRYIDSAKIRKVKDVKYKVDEKTGVKVVTGVEEFFVFDNSNQKKTVANTTPSNTGVKLTADSISFVSSGLLDESRARVVSYLHKAIKPVNQLRMMEDSLVIYRLTRAPERRIFYIDVGAMRGKAIQEHIEQQAAKYRNKLIYDADTGRIKDDRKHMAMTEDYWLPRLEGGRGTEISTLPGGQNLGEIDDIIYFQKGVFRALNVPADRLEQQSSYTLGRSTEIQRDEVKFQKFIDRLRTKFSKLFLDILRKQLVLKGIITEEDWKRVKQNVYIDFQKDNYFTELKEIEMMRERMNIVDQSAQYLGQLFSKEYLMKNVLRLDDHEIKAMEKQMKSEEGDPEPQEQAPQAQPQPQQQVQPQPQEEKPSQEEGIDWKGEQAKAHIELMESVKNYLETDE